MEEPDFIMDQDPWVLAFECTRGRCDLDSIVGVLRKILLESDVGSREYLWALEFIKAFKARAKGGELKLFAMKLFIRELRGKLLRDASPTTIVSVYEENFYLAMGLLTIWEYLIMVGMSDSIGAYIINLIEDVWGSIAENYRRVRDLVKPVIEGPLAMLPHDTALGVLKKIMAMPDKGDTLLFKIETLYTLTRTLPPKILLYNKDYIDFLVDTLKRIANGITEIMEKDPDKAVILANELAIVLNALDKLCLTELMDPKPCSNIREAITDKTNEIYRTIGSITMVMLKNIEQQ